MALNFKTGKNITLTFAGQDPKKVFIEMSPIKVKDMIDFETIGRAEGRSNAMFVVKRHP